MIDSNALIEMMESSFDGVWITDGEGKVLFANSANASLLGVSKAELEGRTTQQLLDEKIFSNSVILEVIRQKKQISKSAGRPYGFSILRRVPSVQHHCNLSQ